MQRGTPNKIVGGRCREEQLSKSGSLVTGADCCLSNVFETFLHGLTVNIRTSNSAIVFALELNDYLIFYFADLLKCNIFEHDIIENIINNMLGKG